MSEATVKNEMELVYFPPCELMAHPENRGVDEGPEMEELKRSIAELGIIQPLVVRRKEGEMWPEILAGHRRARAACGLGLASVPCIVRECTDDEAMAFLFVENFERLSLNAIEEAEGMEAWMRVCNVGVEEVARRISRPVQYVQAMLHLNDLPTPARKLVRTGAVSRETLLVLGQVDAEVFQEAVQLVLFPAIQSTPLNARQARDVIKNEIEYPLKQKRDWNAKREKVRKAFEKVHAGCGLKIVVPLWEELEAELYTAGDWASAHFSPSDDTVWRWGMEFVDPAQSGTVSWATLSSRHGLQGVVKPAGGTEVCLVRADLIAEGERSLHAAGMESILRPMEKESGKGSVSSEQEDEEERESGGWGDGGSEEPPDERHVRRDAGAVMMISRAKVERVKEVLEKLWEGNAPSAGDLHDLPPGWAAWENASPGVLGTRADILLPVLEWILSGAADVEG